MHGKFRFPLDGVSVSREEELPAIDKPLVVTDSLRVSPRECLLTVPEVGSFYAVEGREVIYSAVPGADPEWVRLYLNGQVLVALLHQRKIISFHASSFVYDGRGVMILGETGAGKSSVTLAFALNACPDPETGIAGDEQPGDSNPKPAGFLTDDLTPVVFEGSSPCIMPLNRKVKIRQDTAEELGIGTESLTEAEAGTGKKYLRLAPVQMKPFPLGVIVKIETGQVKEPLFSTPSPAERFSLLRSEVCSWEMLAGMPETEGAYLHQLVDMVEHTEFIRVQRPAEIGLKEFASAVREALDRSWRR